MRSSRSRSNDSSKRISQGGDDALAATDVTEPIAVLVLVSSPTSSALRACSQITMFSIFDDEHADCIH